MAELHALILSLFSADEFRRWLRHGPDNEVMHELPVHGSYEDLVANCLDALERRGGINSAFFERLYQVRPGRAGAIRQIEASRSVGAMHGPSTRARVTRIAMILCLFAAVVLLIDAWIDGSPLRGVAGVMALLVATLLRPDRSTFRAERAGVRITDIRAGRDSTITSSAGEVEISRVSAERDVKVVTGRPRRAGD